jgi:Zn-dependent peptidase ImmA (M78 family)
LGRQIQRDFQIGGEASRKVVGRSAFTLGHEFGHYVPHRDLIETDADFAGCVYWNEESILQCGGGGIEKEVDRFAAALLMPLHDFRRQLPRERADFERRSEPAKRYSVSLTAVILRWLEYTERHAMMIVSNAARRARVRERLTLAVNQFR